MRIRDALTIAADVAAFVWSGVVVTIRATTVLYLGAIIVTAVNVDVGGLAAGLTFILMLTVVIIVVTRWAIRESRRPTKRSKRA